MRVLHVINSLTRQGGGPSRSSQGLVAGLRAAGVDAWLMTLARREEPWIRGVDKFVNGEPFEDVLQRARPDIVHLHGIWQKGLHRCAVVCQRKNVPYVIAPRGMLEPWSLRTKWLKKRVARFLYQDRDLRLAAALHATAESEAEQFRALGFRNPCIISPNGVNVPDSLPPSPTLAATTRRVLFMSRMHPKKGVLELVESWARVLKRASAAREWSCELVYTLNGETEREYEKKVKQRIVELGMTFSEGKDAAGGSRPAADFMFTGPLNDDEKWKAYVRADLFVLPTYSENFGIVVPEALYAGVPVITTKGTPWSELVESASGRSGWWIDLPEERGRWEALETALREATATRDTDLRRLGQNGRALVERRYLWPAVCGAVKRGYEQILDPQAAVAEGCC